MALAVWSRISAELFCPRAGLCALLVGLLRGEGVIEYEMLEPPLEECSAEVFAAMSGHAWIRRVYH